MEIKVIKGKRNLKKNLFKWLLKSMTLFFIFYAVFVTDEENEEYFVKTARELNLSKHNERIFVNISGN